MTAPSFSLTPDEAYARYTLAQVLSRRHTPRQLWKLDANTLRWALAGLADHPDSGALAADEDPHVLDELRQLHCDVHGSPDILWWHLQSLSPLACAVLVRTAGHLAQVPA